MPILEPSPAILRTEALTDKKLLVVDTQNPSLNDFQMFMAISDRAFNREQTFLFVPHATRIMWGGHRIIYIFTRASGDFSLYYDIELFEDIGLTGGKVLPTTTIITRNRIFIPVPSNLKKFFELTGGRKKKKFFVRFDTIRSH